MTTLLFFGSMMWLILCSALWMCVVERWDNEGILSLLFFMGVFFLPYTLAVDLIG